MPYKREDTVRSQRLSGRTALGGTESNLFRNSEQLQHASRTEEYPHDASDPDSLIAYFINIEFLMTTLPSIVLDLIL